MGGWFGSVEGDGVGADEWLAVVGWDEEPAGEVGALEGPASFVEPVVVVAAEGDAVGEVGVAAVFPGGGVVDLAAVEGDVAEGVAAASVEDAEGAALVAVEGAVLASAVERRACRVEVDVDVGAVAGESFGGGPVIVIGVPQEPASQACAWNL